MKKMRKICILTVSISLLILAITPIGLNQSIKSKTETKLSHEKEASTELVEFTVFSCKGDTCEKTTIKVPLNEANELRTSFNKIHSMNLPLEEKLNLQLTLLKEKRIIPQNVTMEDLEQIAKEKFKNLDIERFSDKLLDIANSEIIADTFCVLEFALFGFGLVLRMNVLEGILSQILNVTIGEEDINTYLAGVFVGLYGEAGTLSPKGPPQYAEFDSYLAGLFIGLVGYVVMQLGCIIYGPFVAGVGIAGFTLWAPLY